MDGKASASVVVVDPAQAAAERNQAAKRALSDAMEKPLALHVFRGLEYTIPYVLKVVGEEAEAQKAKSLLKRSFDECNEHLNTFNPASEISVLNSLPANKPHRMSKHLQSVLDGAFRVYAGSGGMFDPGCAPVAAALKEHLMANSKPDIQQYAEATTTWGTIKSLRVDWRSSTVVKQDERTKLDLGGIAKGYTVDLALEYMLEAGISNVFLDWGGDCKGIGLNQKREQWRVGIIRPPSVEELVAGSSDHRDPDKATYLRVVRLDNDAVATSGDYENLFKVGSGQLVTTHFNPRSLQFSSPNDKTVAQVSVQCSSCMIADALATTSLIKGDFAGVRRLLEPWRLLRYSVSDFTAFVRSDQLLAQMHHVATENAEMKANRIAMSLPARVVVVGGGLAGLSAAIEAARANSSVILIEKTEKLGGNSAKATSGINGWGTHPQGAKDIADDGRFFERDTYVSGLGGKCDPGLVQTLSIKSREAIHWLMKDFNLPLTVVSQLGGHSRPRTHRAPDKPDGTPVPIGWTIMQHLIHAVNTVYAGKITVMTETAVTRLLTRTQADAEGRTQVYGVAYSHKGSVETELSADSVVITTGGFGNDRSANSLLKEYTPELESMPTTNGAFATGDGMKMARAIGARMVDMDKVQLHPTGLLDPNDPSNPTKYLGPEALRGSGGILLNQHGKRFVNELDLRSVVSAAIIDQGNVYPGSNGCKVAFCVMNGDSVKLFGPNSLSFYRDRLKLFTEVQDISGLAKLIGIAEAVVVETLTEYGKACAHKKCPQTGKSVFPCQFSTEGPFTVALVTPSIHYTMGGVAINPAAEVLDSTETTGIGRTHRRTILGLFAAGEVTGGVHGKNRLGGNSLLECVVFGRIAGDRAATILQKRPTALSDEWCTVVLREIVEGEEFGQGSRVLRFNLPGSMQRSGLKLGQFVAIKGEWDGRQLLGYYSPITLPQEPGVIAILARVDKGSLKEWINALSPGDAVYMKACGGLTIRRDPAAKSFYLNETRIDSIAMIAGGTGIAPMLQLIRAALKPPYTETIKSLNLIYAAEEVSELTYRDILQHFKKKAPGSTPLHCHFVLNKPPPGWTDGVGFIDREILSRRLPSPSKGLLVVICGPPVMQRIVVGTLVSMGYEKHLVRTVDEDSTGTSRL